MKVFAENRKAKNSYDFHEFYEAGVVLSGPETKSVRNGAVSIVDAFGIIDDEEAYVMEMNIEPYKYANISDYDPKSPRKLLLHKGEIKKLIGLLSQKGYKAKPNNTIIGNAIKPDPDLKLSMENFGSSGGCKYIYILNFLNSYLSH